MSAAPAAVVPWRYPTPVESQEPPSAATGEPTYERADEELERHLAFNREVAEETRRLRVREAARAALRAEQAGEQPAPDAGTLAELLARPEAPGWRVQEVLPAGGRMLLAAQRKTGKSTCAGNLARSLLTGEPFLGRFPVEPLTGRVVVLNYEVTGTTFAQWMADIGVSPDGLYVVNLRGRRNLLATDEGRGELGELIRRAEGEVLVVDPFGRAYTGRSQNDAAEVTPWLVRLDELAERAGVTELVLTAHAGWDQERTRGSTALEDWPDSILTMTREEETGQRFVRAEGRDVDIEEAQLAYDAPTRRLTLSGAGSRKQVRADGRLDRLALAVKEIAAADPGVNTAGIGRALRDRDEPLQKGDENKAAKHAAARGWVLRKAGPKGSWQHFPPENGPAPPTTPDHPRGVAVSTPDPPYKTGGTHGGTQPTSTPGRSCSSERSPERVEPPDPDHALRAAP